jgi:hypothetical protein
MWDLERPPLSRVDIQGDDVERSPLRSRLRPGTASGRLRRPRRGSAASARCGGARPGARYGMVVTGPQPPPSVDEKVCVRSTSSVTSSLKDGGGSAALLSLSRGSRSTYRWPETVTGGGKATWRPVVSEVAHAHFFALLPAAPRQGEQATARRDDAVRGGGGEQVSGAGHEGGDGDGRALARGPRRVDQWVDANLILLLAVAAPVGEDAEEEAVGRAQHAGKSGLATRGELTCMSQRRGRW